MKIENEANLTYVGDMGLRDGDNVVGIMFGRLPHSNMPVRYWLVAR